MPRKKRSDNPPPLRGVGPIVGSTCCVFVVYVDYIMPHDEWGRSGRPFWAIEYLIGHPDKPSDRRYSKTMIPADEPFSVVVTVPVACSMVNACHGVRGDCHNVVSVPCSWEEGRTYGESFDKARDRRSRHGNRSRRGATPAPVCYTWDSRLDGLSALTFAAADDPTEPAPAPRGGPAVVVLAAELPPDGPDAA